MKKKQHVNYMSDLSPGKCFRTV